MSRFVNKDLGNKKRFVNKEQCCEIEVRERQRKKRENGEANFKWV
jgi:hypothetical protein